jgi:hypothetical protein
MKTPEPTKHEYHLALEKAGHVLKLDEDSDSVDIFAYEYGYCNGPECVKCGDSWCHHCQPKIKECRG